MIGRDDVLKALQSVIDPEIGLDIVNLGLVERVEISDSDIRIGLIMTTPACPQGDLLSRQAQAAVEQSTGGDRPVTVEVLGTPLWSPERMSDAAKQRMGWR